MQTETIHSNQAAEAHRTPELLKDTDLFAVKVFEPAMVLNGSQKVLDDAHRLRGVVYTEEMGFLPPEVLDAHGREIDEYDAQSLHFVVQDKQEEIVGTSRLIINSEDNPLPVKRLFSDVYLDPSSCEASRLVVERNNRAKTNELLVSIALMRSMIGAANKANIDYIYAVVEEGLWDHFKKIGIPFTQVGEPEFLPKYNSHNYPLRVKTSEILDGIWEKDLSFIDDRESSHGALTTRPRKLATFFSRSYEDSMGIGGFGLEDFVYDARTVERNYGFLSKEEQQKLHESTVAIAGAGGDGGQLAMDLARLGVGSFKLADPEEFERENINRQAGSNYRTVGENKALAVAREILHINPFANVLIYTDGVTEGNVHEFMSDVDIVLDETEFTHPELGVMIAREARKQKVANVIAFNVGLGAYVTSFVPEGRKLEKQLGIDEDLPLEEVKTMDVPLERWLGHIPSYVDSDVFKLVANNEISAPSVTQGVSLASGIAATQVMLHLLDSEKRPSPIISPKAISYDALDGEKIVRFQRTSYYTSAIKMLMRNALNLNHKVSK